MFPVTTRTRQPSRFLSSLSGHNRTQGPGRVNRKSRPNDDHGAQGWYYRHFGRQFARARGLGHGLGTENGSFLFETTEVGETDGTMRISVERRSRTRPSGSNPFQKRKRYLPGRSENGRPTMVPNSRCISLLSLSCSIDDSILDFPSASSSVVRTHAARRQLELLGCVLCRQ